MDPGDTAKVYLLSDKFGGDNSAAEPNDNGNFTAVLLDKPPTDPTAKLVMTSIPIDVAIAPLGGTATEGTGPSDVFPADYFQSPAGLTHTIAANTFSVPININVLDDTVAPPGGVGPAAEATTETVTSWLVGHTPIIPTTGTGGSPPASTTAGLPSQLMDGNPGSGNTQTVYIDDNDSVKVVIRAIDDKLFEDSTTNGTGKFRVELQNAAGTVVSQPGSTPFVFNYDGASTAMFGEVSITYASESGTLTGSVGSSSVSLVIPANEKWVDFTVDAVDDMTVEPDETVVAKVTGAPGPDTSATITVCDDDSAQVHVGWIADAVEDSNPGSSTNPEAEGSADGKFEFYLSKPSSTDTVVTFTVMGGTLNPASSSDYKVLHTAAGGLSAVQVKIPAGTSGAGLASNPMITFDAIEDILVEGTESVKVSVVSVDSGDPDIAPGNPAEAKIVDNDGTFVGVMAMDDQAYEDKTNASPDGLLTFSVGDLLGAPNPYVTTPLTLNYSITGAGITSGDFTLVVQGATGAYFGASPGSPTSSALTGSLTIPAGVTTVDVKVVATEDAVVETLETLNFQLTSISSPFTVGAAINPLKSGDTVDIHDNDTGQVFLTHQAIPGGILPDEYAYEEGCYTAAAGGNPTLMGADGYVNGMGLVGCTGTSTTNDNIVPITIGLTSAQ